MTDPVEQSGLVSQRYERQGVLGSGGQGVVYRAFDRWLGQPVAIKVLNTEAARQPHMAERLMREQQALSALDGTAAVKVLDIYRNASGELCLVMELLAGRTLDEELAALEARNERMPLGRVAEIFAPIVDTLETADKAGIVHRDLKPANVFLLDGGGVRLLDFGMARLRRAAPLTAAGTVMGSPSFMAPEAWGGRSELVDHRADVYSLGVILFLVLAGELPFSGLTLYEKFLGSTKAPRPSLARKRPELPRDADEWVALALAVDREQRFRNVRALWNAFVATFDVEPSFWAKAKRRVGKLVGAGAPPSSSSADPPRTTDPGLRREPSFVSAALARTVKPARAGAPTIEVLPAPEIAPAPEAAPAPVEATIELTELDFSHAPPSRERPVEKTLELSSSDLVPNEDTRPVPAEGTAPAETPDTPSDPGDAR